MRAENREYIALVKQAGWTPADAARRLDLARSSTGRFLTGEIAPSLQVLKLVKLILAAEQPGALGAAQEPRADTLATWEREVINDLRGLRPDDRARTIKALRALTADLPRHAPVSLLKPASSAPDSGAAKLLKKVSAGVHKRGGGRTS